MDPFINPWNAGDSPWFNQEPDTDVLEQNEVEEVALTVPSRSNFPTPEQIKSEYPPAGTDYCSQAFNECAIRMSIAFHRCGVDIGGSTKFRKTHVDQGTGIIHQPGAKPMADWLHNALKYPKTYLKDSGQWQRDDFINKEGIIFFAHEQYGGDGPGHIDVISGGAIGSGFYPNKKIWFWEYKDGKYI